MAEFNIQTGAVRLAPKQQYFNLVMNTYESFTEICKTESIDGAKLRTGMLVRFLIAYMPSPDIQAEFNTMRNEKIKEAQKINDASKRLDAVFDINIDIIGKIMVLVDQMIGLIDRQSIMQGTGTEDMGEYTNSDETSILEVQDYD